MPRLVPCLLAFLPLFGSCADWQTSGRAPNIIVLFADDLGYGDLGCYGHPTIRTPNLDRMASEGARFTQFYSAASVCTPSRAALLTGRLPVRNGMCHKERRVLFPNSAGGLPASEITIAEALRDRGYATACIGKWHLGHLPEYLPTRQGFDEFFGLPYSNDMDAVKGPAPKERWSDPKSEYWNVPLMRNEFEIERPVQQEDLTRRYTEEAIAFIDRNAQQPFFLYLPYTMVHVPLFASKKFRGRSARGRYGDAVEEIDWSVGRILSHLRQLKIAKDTLVVFTSDNGPWLSYGKLGGSAGLLRSGKGSTWEGGVREPCIVWRPGSVEPGLVTQELGTTMDLFTTILRMAGAAEPTDREIDGVDLSPVLTGTGKSPRDTVYYYAGADLYAIRKGAYKLHFVTHQPFSKEAPKKHKPPLLFDLHEDPGESFNVAAAHKDAVRELANLAARHERSVRPVPSQLSAKIGK